MNSLHDGSISLLLLALVLLPLMVSAYFKAPEGSPLEEFDGR